MMLRAASFSRRNQRRSQRQDDRNPAADSDEDEQQPHAASPRPDDDFAPGRQGKQKGGVFGAIKRTASFNRRSRRNGDRSGHVGSAAAGGSSRTYDDDVGSNGSRPTSSERALRGDDDDPPPPSHSHSSSARAAGAVNGAAAACVHQGASTAQTGLPAPGTMHGWLKKKHTHTKGAIRSQWAKRYFNVDENRGTLSYSKSEFKRPTVVLPLCDINQVKTLEMEIHGPFCFVISCPPVHLTVQADNVDDRKRWITGLLHYSAIWRNKASGGSHVAVASAGQAASPSPTPYASPNGYPLHESDARRYGDDGAHDAQYGRDAHGQQQSLDRERDHERRLSEELDVHHNSVARRENEYEAPPSASHRGGGRSPYEYANGRHEQRPARSPGPPHDDPRQQYDDPRQQFDEPDSYRCEHPQSGARAPVPLRRGRNGSPQDEHGASPHHNPAATPEHDDRREGWNGGGRRQADDGYGVDAPPTGRGGRAADGHSSSNGDDEYRHVARHSPAFHDDDPREWDVAALRDDDLGDADEITGIATFEIDSGDDSDEDPPDSGATGGVIKRRPNENGGGTFDSTTHGVFAAAMRGGDKHGRHSCAPAPISAITSARTGPRKPACVSDAHIDLAAMLSDDEEVDDEYEKAVGARMGRAAHAGSCAMASSLHHDEPGCAHSPPACTCIALAHAPTPPSARSGSHAPTPPTDPPLAWYGRYGRYADDPLPAHADPYANDTHGALPAEETREGSCWQRSAGAADGRADFDERGERAMPWLEALPRNDEDDALGSPAMPSPPAVPREARPAPYDDYGEPEPRDQYYADEPRDVYPMCADGRRARRAGGPYPETGADEEPRGEPGWDDDEPVRGGHAPAPPPPPPAGAQLSPPRRARGGGLAAQARAMREPN